MVLVKCPECGKVINEVVSNCPYCGYPIHINNQNQAQQSGSEFVRPIVAAKEKKYSQILKIIFWIIAGIIVIWAFAAAGQIAKGAVEIGNIRSVGGETMEEVYYENLGFVYFGFANLVRVIGIFISSVLVWLGYKA